MSTRKEMDKAQESIEAAVIKWKPLMGLAHWHTEVHYYRREKHIPERFRAPKAGGFACVMWVEMRWMYLKATISVSLREAATYDAHELESFVRHELAHITVNEMREWADHPPEGAVDHEERVVTMLEQAFGYTYAAGMNDRTTGPRTKQKKGV